MRISWLKISSRIAVLAIIYLLLSIPDSKFQGEQAISSPKVLKAIYTSKEITHHIPYIIKLSEEEKLRIGDSLNNSISSRLLELRSELFTSNSQVIDTLINDFGLLTAVIGSSQTDVTTTLKNLWIWRQQVKKQSLFWSINKDGARLKTASILNFINECEEFIAVNKDFSFTITADSIAFSTPDSIGIEIKSGDILLSANDITYPYYGLSKVVPDLTPTLNIISLNGDSTFLVGSAPLSGLQAVEVKEKVNIFSTSWIYLRLRQDLPELISNPKISEKSATFAYDFAKNDKSSYDFLLKPLSYGHLFEVELLRFAFNEIQASFIMPFSSIDNQHKYGLNSLGIRNFDLVSSAEIQYHPAIDYLSIMRNGPEIKMRNVNLAAEMACFMRLDHDLVKTLKWQLPKYRILNGVSMILKLVDGKTIIPDGMASETALIYEYLANQKQNLLPRLENEIITFEKNNNYYPTYSEILDLAISQLPSS